MPCPGNPSEFCGGKASSAKRELRKRQAQAGILLSLFANIPAVGISANSTSSNPPSTSPLSTSPPSTNPKSTLNLSILRLLVRTLPVPCSQPSFLLNTPSRSGPANSTTSTGFMNPSPTVSTIGGGNAPFGNGTNPGSTGLLTAIPTANSTTTPSSLFGNGSSTTSPSSFHTGALNAETTTSAGVSSSPTVPPGVPTSSSRTGSDGLEGTPSSGKIGSVLTTGLPANPTNFVGFTITEMYAIYYLLLSLS
jgi:hypothetical protein